MNDSKIFKIVFSSGVEKLNGNYLLYDTRFTFNSYVDAYIKVCELNYNNRDFTFYIKVSKKA